jgi:hypothetical protein
MKKNLFLFVAILTQLFFSNISNAQRNNARHHTRNLLPKRDLAGSSYDFSKITGTYRNLTNPTLLSDTGIWDQEQYKLPIGFNFTVYDQIVDTVIVDDGSAGFVFFQDSTGFYESDYYIDVFNTDFIDRGNRKSLSPVSYLLEGASPSRILKIEWNNAGFYGEYERAKTKNDFVNVQLWLYETSNHVEIHIGPSSIKMPNQDYYGAKGGYFGLWQYYTDADNISLTGPADNPVAVYGVIDTTVIGTPSNGVIYQFTPQTVGIDETVFDYTAIYPNPFRSEFVISYKQIPTPELSVKIFDLTGKTMFGQQYCNLPASGDMRFDMSRLAQGIYFVRFSSGGIMWYQKMMKE